MKFIILFFSFCFARLSIADDMFSSRILEGGISEKGIKTSGKLLVVRGKLAFIRSAHLDEYTYEVARNGCYFTENGHRICINNEEIVSKEKVSDIEIASDYIDEFYAENSYICNQMKFDLTFDFILHNRRMNGVIFQVYDTGYYNVMKLYVVEYDNQNYITNDKNGNLIAFIIDGTRNLSCSGINDYAFLSKNEQIALKSQLDKKGIEKELKNSMLSDKEILQYKYRMSFRKLIVNGLKIVRQKKIGDIEVLRVSENRVLQIRPEILKMFKKVGAFS